MTRVSTPPVTARPARRPVLRGALVLVALAVSLLFLYSGVDKWSDIERFERIVVSHGLIGQAWAGPAAATLACIELGVGALGMVLVLFTGPKVLSPLFIAQATLFVGFAVYAGVLVGKPPPEPTSCGCGVLSAPIAGWSGILARNAIAAAALGAGSVLALKSERRLGTRPAAR